MIKALAQHQFLAAKNGGNRARPAEMGGSENLGVDEVLAVELVLACRRVAAATGHRPPPKWISGTDVYAHAKASPDGTLCAR